MTTPKTTLAALQAALDCLKPGGVLSVISYVGHEGGTSRSRLVTDSIWVAHLALPFSGGPQEAKGCILESHPLGHYLDPSLQGNQFPCCGSTGWHLHPQLDMRQTSNKHQGSPATLQGRHTPRPGVASGIWQAKLITYLHGNTVVPRCREGTLRSRNSMQRN